MQKLDRPTYQISSLIYLDSIAWQPPCQKWFTSGSKDNYPCPCFEIKLLLFLSFFKNNYLQHDLNFAPGCITMGKVRNHKTQTCLIYRDQTLSNLYNVNYTVKSFVVRNDWSRDLTDCLKVSLDQRSKFFRTAFKIDYSSIFPCLSIVLPILFLSGVTFLLKTIID